MTPRTYWDRAGNLWELHPDGNRLVLIFDEKTGPEHEPCVWIEWWKLDRSIIGPLVASC